MIKEKEKGKPGLDFLIMLQNRKSRETWHVLCLHNWTSDIQASVLFHYAIEIDGSHGQNEILRKKENQKHRIPKNTEIPLLN